MHFEKFLEQKREDILRIAAKHGAYNVRVFGSAARGEAGPTSDIDFLVNAGPSTSPWFPASLKIDLEELLGRKVDVVTEDSIYWLLRRRIIRGSKPL